MPRAPGSSLTLGPRSLVSFPPLKGASERFSLSRSASSHGVSAALRDREQPCWTRGREEDRSFTENTTAEGRPQAGDLETRARSGSREEAPTPPCSDPENSSDGRAACQLEGRLAPGDSEA